MIFVVDSAYNKTLDGLPRQLGANELSELDAPLRRLLGSSNKGVEFGARAWLADLAQGGDSPQSAALEFRSTLQVLLHGVLRNCGSVHALLQRRREVVQALSDGCRCDLRKTEEHHVADDLDLIRVICEASHHTAKEFVQLQLRQASVELCKPCENERREILH